MNIIERVRQNAASFAPKIAVIEGDSAWTHAELWDRVDRLSNHLALHVRKGERVLAWLSNCHEAIESELATLQIGAVWVTLNSRMTWAEVRGVIAATEPRVFITDDEGIRKSEASRLDGVECLVTGDSYEAAIGSSSPVRPEVETGDEDIARLRYTSGTTGSARAAVLPHRVYLASLENLQNELHSLDSSDRVLHAAPLTHASGALVYPILAAGGANVLLPRFDPEEVLATIERERITTMFIVPTILHRLSLAPSFETRDLSSLKTVMYGGAPTPPAQLLPAIERLGSVLVHIYGMTEAPYPITTLQREEHYAGNPRLGAIGKPTKVCEARVVNESGDETAPGEIGEIRLRGQNVMSGYWNDEAATREMFRGEWLATGDLGTRDADGFITIVDRKKDVIISGGFNVYAKEVELALCEHPAVAEAAVVGVPDSDWGEAAVAFLVARPGARIDPKEIARWCRERLSGYKRPKRIEILAELPKNSSGKIAKKNLVTSAPSPPTAE